VQKERLRASPTFCESDINISILLSNLLKGMDWEGFITAPPKERLYVILENRICSEVLYFTTMAEGTPKTLNSQH